MDIKDQKGLKVSEYEYTGDIPEDMELQTFQIKYTDWLYRHAEILDINGPTPTTLYKIDGKVRKPQLTFKSANDEIAFASSNYHSFSTGIDVDMNGQSVALKASSKWKQNEYTYSSPAFNGSTITWKLKTGCKTSDWTCLDERMLPIARVSINFLVWREVGKLDIIGEFAAKKDVRDEVAAMAVTMAYLTVIRNATLLSASSSSAAASSAAAASVSV